MNKPERRYRMVNRRILVAIEEEYTDAGRARLEARRRNDPVFHGCRIKTVARPRPSGLKTGELIWLS